jgi:signal transduction histidine kinase/HPt (histidine-containing phosphotransfer) domain-containing protein
MPAETITALLVVEDNPGDARLVRETLSGVRGERFVLEYADRLSAAIERLATPGIDVVLLDLSLPDSNGVETITRLHESVPLVPIIALSGNDDERVIQSAVRNGADDFLVKGTFQTDSLLRSIGYALDRRLVREELAQARDSALESARLRAEFLANMSHEIRTPLNGIIGITRLLADTQLTTEQREMSEIASVSADTLLKIVNDILDFSKISAGKVVFEEADFDLGTTVESVIQMFAEQAQTKNVTINSFIEGDVPLLLLGDAGRLSQVLTNLVGNAIKFTPRGETTVRVGRVTETDDEAILRFHVRDTGIGIPLEGQRHVFQAFAQADGSTTRKYGGTGLGLAISAQLVELMGGTIGLQSEPGSGSTFWFTATFRKQPASHQELTIQARLKGVHVLIADHNDASGHLIAEHLAAWGMRSELVNSATEAMAALRSAEASGDRFALALIDIQLSEMDGLAVARAIKSEPALAATRLLGIYSLGGRPAESQMKGSGMAALLAKPIKQSQLFNTLTAMMAAPSADATVPSLPPSQRRRPVREIKSRIPEALRVRTRILLVEDNLVNQQVAMRMLERMGYKADAVENGREALESLAQRDYDVVLMDCQMPEMDGYSATSEFRRREGSSRRTTIIGITAHALPGDREDCLKAGMDDYLAKPVTPQDMVETIDRWVLTINHLDSNGNVNGNHSVDTGAHADDLTDADKPTIDETVLAQLREFERPDESSFVAHLISMFLSDLTMRLTEIHAALAVADGQRVNRAAHALKGASGELGAARLRALSSRLELQTANQSVEGLDGLIGIVEEEANRVRVALEAQKVAAVAARVQNTATG